VYQQTQRWTAAGCFAALVHDLRSTRRLAAQRPPEPGAVVFDSHTLQSTPESNARDGDDGATCKHGTMGNVAATTLGHLIALHGTPVDARERAAITRRFTVVQEAANGRGDRRHRLYWSRLLLKATPARAPSMRLSRMASGSEESSCPWPSAAPSPCVVFARAVPLLPQRHDGR
jgi:hypothetical protein